MTYSNYRIPRRRSEEGNVLTELSLVMIILLVFFFGILDVGNLLRNYMIINQCLREGVRLASTMPSLEDTGINSIANSLFYSNTGNYTSTNLKICSVSPTASPIECYHYLVQEKVKQIIGWHLLNVNRNTEILESQYTAAGFADQRDDTIQVRYRVNYVSLFGASPFNGFQIDVSQRGAYLY